MALADVSEARAEKKRRIDISGGECVAAIVPVLVNWTISRSLVAVASHAMNEDSVNDVRNASEQKEQHKFMRNGPILFTFRE